MALSQELEQELEKALEAFKSQSTALTAASRSKDGLRKAIASSPKLKTALKTNRQSLNEDGGMMAIGFIAALPKLIELLGGLTKSLTSKGGAFTKIRNLVTQNKDSKGFEEKGAKIGNAITGAGHKGHAAYLKILKTALNLIPGFSGLETHQKDKVTKAVFNIFIAYLLYHSGVGVYHSLTHGHAGAAGVEAALTAVKNGEVLAYISEVIGLALLAGSFDSEKISHDDDETSGVDTSSFTGFSSSAERNVYRPKTANRLFNTVTIKPQIKADIRKSLEELKYGLFEGDYLISSNYIKDPEELKKTQEEYTKVIKSIKQELIDEEQAAIDRTGGKRKKTNLNVFKNMSFHPSVSSKGKYAHVKADYIPHGKHNPYEKH